MGTGNLTRFGYLMELLGISITELASAINIERTSVSKWKSGSRKLSASMPYFNDIIEFFILKNQQLGGNFLEDFFDNISNNKKVGVKDLRKSIRNYILNFPDNNHNNNDITVYKSRSLYTSNYDTYHNLEGRKQAFSLFLDKALSIQEPTKILIIELDKLVWASTDLHYMILFFEKLERILKIGHTIDFIFYTDDKFNFEVHKMFLSLCFYENISIQVLNHGFNKTQSTSVYLIQNTLLLKVYNSNGRYENISCLFSDKLIVTAEQVLADYFRGNATSILVASKPSEIEKVHTMLSNLSFLDSPLFYSGKALSFTSMSEELINEILHYNNIPSHKRKQCFNFYYLLRSKIEKSVNTGMGGCYYNLDEITSYLSYDFSINYPLSAMTNTIIKMERSHYLKHFEDTAKLILSDKRYKIILHRFPTTRKSLMWYRENGWTVVTYTNEVTGKSKILFCDDLRVVDINKYGFQQIFDKTPAMFKDCEYISKTFLQISKGELC